MMALLRPWWLDRSPREQSMLLGLAGLLALLLLWLAVLRPLADARRAAETRLQVATASLGEARRLATAIHGAEARAAASASMPLPRLIEQRLAAAGITAGTVEAQSDGSIRLAIAAVRAPVLIAWLTALEQRDGLVVERAAIAANSDPSVNAMLIVRSAR